MFSLLLTFKALKGIVGSIWSVVSKLLPLITLISGLFALYSVFESNYNAVVAYLDGLAAHLSGRPTSEWIAKANRLFPVSEVLVMASSLFSLRILAFVVRFLRSFMPF